MSILECNRAERRADTHSVSQSHSHKDVEPASLPKVRPVFIFPKSLIFSPPKQPLYQAKGSYFCSRKLSASGGRAPVQRVWGNSPQTLSSDVHPLVSTVSGHRQFLAVWCQNIVCKCVKASDSGGLLPLDPLPELCPWTTLGGFRSSYPPAPLAVLSY